MFYGNFEVFNLAFIIHVNSEIRCKVPFLSFTIIYLGVKKCSVKSMLDINVNTSFL